MQALRPRNQGLLAWILMVGGVWAACLAGLAGPQEGQTEEPAWQAIDQRAADNEQCLVCRTPIQTGQVIEIRYKGRNFHVMPEMLARFADDPDAYFAQLQARSALFDEGGTSQRLGSLWLWIGLYVLAGLIGAAVCSYLAVSKSMNLLPWFIAGLLFNIVAVIAVLLVPGGDSSIEPAGIPSGMAKVPLTRSPASCPDCDAQVHPAASSCSRCGSSLQPLVEAETSRV